MVLHRGNTESGRAGRGNFARLSMWAQWECLLTEGLMLSGEDDQGFSEVFPLWCENVAMGSLLSFRNRTECEAQNPDREMKFHEEP